MDRGPTQAWKGSPMTGLNWLSSWVERGAPVLFDGAMGTMLHTRGVSFDTCFDELNLTQPDLVLSIHRAYAHAGAQILETNSFGANRYKLASQGLEGRLAEINAAAVSLAKWAAGEAGREIRIAGSVGPLGVRLAPFGRVQPEQARQAFTEQIEALAQAGADLILLETHSDLHELREAVATARQVCDLPIAASVTFTRDDRTLLGDPPEHVARTLGDLGVDILGANCSSGPAQLLRIGRQMRQAAPETHLLLMPNAGWPERVGGRIMYPAAPAYFGDYALAFWREGASFVGGCCGTTPDHIAAMHAALTSAEEPPRQVQVHLPERLPSEPPAPGEEPTQLAQKLRQGKFVLSVEMDPPRGYALHKLRAGAHLLAEAGSDVINVADSPMARMRMSPWAVCNLIQQEVGVEAVLHFPTRGRNLLRVQGDLLAAHALGVRNVFVVMGDPTAIGDYPDAMDDYDLVPSGLIRLIKHNFNTGRDHAGADIGGATSFFVGCALNLSPQDPEREFRALRKKVQAGADFALTQPVFNPSLAAQFLEAYAARFGPLEIPILVGVLPLYNARHSAFLHHEVPGIQIPDGILRRIHDAGDDSPQEGVRISIELLEQLRSLVQGVYLMPPFGRYDMAAEIIEGINR